MRGIQYLSTITKRGHIFAALFLVTLALAGFASAANSHKGKEGSLRITAPAEVGGVILQPGDYEVREVNTPNGPVVEFVHVVLNEQASELMQAEEEEIVTQVKYTEQTLDSPTKHTQLLLAPNTVNKKAVALEIRGSTVDHLFQPEKTKIDYASK